MFIMLFVSCKKKIFVRKVIIWFNLKALFSLKKFISLYASSFFDNAYEALENNRILTAITECFKKWK